MGTSQPLVCWRDSILYPINQSIICPSASKCVKSMWRLLSVYSWGPVQQGVWIIKCWKGLTIFSSESQLLTLEAKLFEWFLWNLRTWIFTSLIQWFHLVTPIIDVNFIWKLSIFLHIKKWTWVGTFPGPNIQITCKSSVASLNIAFWKCV